MYLVPPRVPPHHTVKPHAFHRGSSRRIDLDPAHEPPKTPPHGAATRRPCVASAGPGEAAELEGARRAERVAHRRSRRGEGAADRCRGTPRRVPQLAARNCPRDHAIGRRERLSCHPSGELGRVPVEDRGGDEPQGEETGLLPYLCSFRTTWILGDTQSRSPLERYGVAQRPARRQLVDRLPRAPLACVISAVAPHRHRAIRCFARHSPWTAEKTSVCCYRRPTISPRLPPPMVSQLTLPRNAPDSRSEIPAAQEPGPGVNRIGLDSSDPKESRSFFGGVTPGVTEMRRQRTSLMTVYWSSQSLQSCPKVLVALGPFPVIWTRSQPTGRWSPQQR